VFLKEEGAKLYSTFSYFLSRNIVELPTSIIFPLLMTLIMYWFVGLSSTVEQFFIFYLVAYLLTLNGISLGLMLGAMILDQKSVAVVTPIVLLPFFLFSGLFKNTGNIPVWIGWIQYISPIKYGFSSWVQNEVQFASQSNVNELNLDTSLWLSIGLLALLGVSFRMLSLLFLWLLRSRLQ
jgi:ABC-type multidrug transport system permease subunit